MRPRVRILCLPDVHRAIGGVKQLFRHVEHLVSLGWDAAMVTEQPGFRPSWFESDAPSRSLYECRDLGEFDSTNTILVLPETYLGIQLSSFRGIDLSHLPRVVFNQNCYYSYSSKVSNLDESLHHFYCHPLMLQVLSISEDTHQFIRQNISLPDASVSRIVNAIEPIFKPQSNFSKRIHWMPRKNANHVQAVLSGLQRATLLNSSGWVGEPLDGLTHQQVADSLNRASLFLSFGHPEGFGLPIAEAMAAGCWVVGFSGGGGRELFRYGASHEVSFGDWSGFLAAIQDFFNTFANDPYETSFKLQRQALAIKSLYSYSEEHRSIDNAWSRIEQAYHDKFS